VPRSRLSRSLTRWAGRHAAPIEFCDRCARVCDARCRATALRDQSLLRALNAGRPVL
jgi:hypothetical protein